jgi:hypothetical protein
MKIGLRLSVAVAAIAFTLGIGSATAQSTPCDACYMAYQACMAKPTGQLLCYGALSRCLKNSTGCNPPN